MHSLSFQKSDIFKNFLTDKNKVYLVAGLGLFGVLMILTPKLTSKNFSEASLCSADLETTDAYREKLEQNLKSIISGIHGAGKAQVMITFENAAETVYATEEKKNKEASEDKSSGEIMRKRESNDCEKKFITVKDGNGGERAIAVTKIEPKVKGVIIICPGGDDPVVKKRIIDAATTALNVTSQRICVTKSQ